MNNITKKIKRKALTEKMLIKIFKRIMGSFENEEEMKQYVVGDTAFTRKRKLTLTNMIKLLFGRTFCTITMYLSLNFKDPKGTVTKQAYSKARINIKPELFIDTNDKMISSYYKECKIERYNGRYVLLAIDGTSIEIPNTKELKEEYGHSQGQKGAKEVARASASCVYDPLNEMILTTTLEKYNTSERIMAKEMVNKIKDENLFNSKEALYIMDRGYFSYEMLTFFEFNKQNYLFRISSNKLVKYFSKMESNDEWMEFSLSEIASKIEDEELKEYAKEQKTIKVRFIKVELETGEIEYLITSVKDIKYSKMKELYFKRWGIETNYDFLKNKLKIENFSGKKKITVEQDFYAGILNGNIEYLIKKVAGKKTTDKREYKPSMNVVSGLYEKIILQNILCGVNELIVSLKRLIKLAKKAFIMITPPEKSTPRKPNDKIRANKHLGNIRPN